MTDTRIDLSRFRPRSGEPLSPFYAYEVIRHVARETDALRSLSVDSRRRLAERRRHEVNSRDRQKTGLPPVGEAWT